MEDEDRMMRTRT